MFSVLVFALLAMTFRFVCAQIYIFLIYLCLAHFTHSSVVVFCDTCECFISRRRFLLTAFCFRFIVRTARSLLIPCGFCARGSLSTVLSFGFRDLCVCASLNLLRAKFDFAVLGLFFFGVGRNLISLCLEFSSSGCVDTEGS